MPRVTGHTTYAPSASVVVLQESVLHAAVLSARGACQCAGLAGAPHAHAGARSVLPGSGVAPARRTWSQVVRNRLSPNRGDGRVCRTHRRTMWRDCDSSAPRSPGFARAATILQASCPTAGLGSCANVEEGVRSAGAAGREVARESGARRVDNLRGAHRESIHSRKCCLDMPTAFATCGAENRSVSATRLCLSVETVRRHRIKSDVAMLDGRVDSLLHERDSTVCRHTVHIVPLVGQPRLAHRTARAVAGVARTRAVLNAEQNLENPLVPPQSVQ